MKQMLRKKPDLVGRARTNSRVTNSAATSGSKQMYELLHETEHRLLHVQAGGSYTSHEQQCQVCCTMSLLLLLLQYFVYKFCVLINKNLVLQTLACIYKHCNNFRV